MNLAAFLALLAAAQAAPAAQQSPAQRPAIQQQFDAASAALDRNDWAGAIRGFEALEASARSPRTLALSRARRGSALVALGRFEEASAALRQALPAIPAGDASLHEDRFLALRTLGAIAEHHLDYPEALRQYRLAAAIPLSDGARLLVQRGIVQTQLFSDAEGALRDSEATLQMATAMDGAAGLRGAAHTLKGRALLNLGRFAEARVELETALRLLGNLSLRVDLADLVARSDLAIAALLSGRPEDARRYLAYTGAGRFARGAVLPEENQPPPCGPDIARDDVVVVEVAVGADGSVNNVIPIYASRQGPSAMIVARAVTLWAFDPESARRLPPLFRSVVRLEIRCSLEPPPGRHIGESRAHLRRLATLGPDWGRALSERATRSPDSLRRELATLGGNDRQTASRILPLLLLIASHAATPGAEKEAALRRALPIAAQLELPPFVIAAIAHAIGRARLAQREGQDRSRGPDYQALLELPEIRASAEAAALVRLAWARTHYHDDDYDEALAIAAAVRALPEARRGGPLEIEALQVQAMVHAARNQPAAARAAFEAMGPGAERCGLAPRQRRIRSDGSDFPRDALDWGFEGWAIVETAIAPVGSVAGTRTVVAYPPFVFGESARRVMGRTSYEPFFTPDGAPCALWKSRVRFVLPS